MTPEAVYANEYFFGNYGLRRFAWITQNRKLFNPFPVSGKQGIFRAYLPDDLELWTP